MARTYLAEDQGRFNEFCALKEPTETYLLEKSRQLFQREATILYRIHHPKFLSYATFEQDQRLFLVQDYVEGKTYPHLLDERKAAGQTFTQAEVLQLLRLLLPSWHIFTLAELFTAISRRIISFCERVMLNRC